MSAEVIRNEARTGEPRVGQLALPAKVIAHPAMNEEDFSSARIPPFLNRQIEAIVRPGDAAHAGRRKCLRIHESRV
jgi:hypothetical protein